MVFWDVSIGGISVCEVLNVARAQLSPSAKLVAEHVIPAGWTSRSSRALGKETLVTLVPVYNVHELTAGISSKIAFLGIVIGMRGDI